MAFDMSDDIFLAVCNDSAIVYSRWKPTKVVKKNIPANISHRCYTDMAFRKDSTRTVYRLSCKNP
jgi:hypothetical protein